MSGEYAGNQNNIWIRIVRVAAWIAAGIWTLFSSLVAMLGGSKATYYTNVVDPISTVRMLISMVEGALNQYYINSTLEEKIHMAMDDVILSGKNIEDVLPWGILNLLIMIGLIYGIYKKNRTCAVLLFLHPVIHIALSGMIRGFTEYYSNLQLNLLIIFIIFSIFLSYFIWSTFSYHIHNKTTGEK